MTSDQMLSLAKTVNLEPGYRGYVAPEDIASFGRLIAQECRRICLNTGSTVDTPRDAADDIAEAFGLNAQ